MKRKEVSEAKAKAREEIRSLLDQIASVQTVPQRILGAASQIEASSYKDILELAKSKTSCSFKHGTLADLLARKEKVQGWLNAIT